MNYALIFLVALIFLCILTLIEWVNHPAWIAFNALAGRFSEGLLPFLNTVPAYIITAMLAIVWLEKKIGLVTKFTDALKSMKRFAGFERRDEQDVSGNQEGQNDFRRVAIEAILERLERGQKTSKKAGGKKTSGKGRASDKS